MYFKSDNSSNGRIRETQKRWINGKSLPYLIKEIEVCRRNEIHIFCSNNSSLVNLIKKLNFFSKRSIPDAPDFNFQYGLTNSCIRLTGDINQALKIFSNREGFDVCSKITADSVLVVLQSEIPQSRYSESQPLLFTLP